MGAGEMSAELTAKPTRIYVPRLSGEGAIDCTILRCLKSEGAQVAAGDLLFTVRAGRIDADVESPIRGTLSRLHVHEGQAARVGAPLAEIVEMALPGAEGEQPERRSRLSARIVAES